MFKIIPIPALKDNYIWMITRFSKNQALIVDPGEAKPVLEILRKKGLKLSGILITHHHWDHTDGIAELLEHFPVPVYASAKEQVPACTHPLSQDDRVHFPELDFEFSILEIPGHTKGHIAFRGLDGIFTGDTLFSAGCGRIFEGTAEQMFESLNKLRNLPDETFVYCGHEYTQNNLRFAKLIEPHNRQLMAYQEALLPSTIKLEKEINPFFRCEEKTVHAAVENHCQKELKTPLDVFTELRRWKDAF